MFLYIPTGCLQLFLPFLMPQLQVLVNNVLYVLIRPISTEHYNISSFRNQNKKPFLWEAAPRPVQLFDDIAHPELHVSRLTTYACNTKHTKSNIKEGGRGDGTEMNAVLSSN